MATAITITSTDKTMNELIVYGTITLSGNYGTGAGTNGDTLSFANQDQIKSESLPNYVEVFEAPPAATASSGQRYIYAPGTTQANGLLQVWTAAGAQLTGGAAYPATPAFIKFRAFFPLFV